MWKTGRVRHRNRFATVMLVWAIATAGCTAESSGVTANIGWGSYGGGYDSRRFADIKQITPWNAARLEEACSILLGDNGPFQAGPIVVGRTLFVTTAFSTAAFDAATCAPKWRRWHRPHRLVVSSVNRGVAYLHGRVFRGTGDGDLLAMDATTGRLLWQIRAVDPSRGEFLSSAPQAWNDLVFIGAAGSDFGVRGKMMAFSAETGRRKWLFYTVPTAHEVGSRTWEAPNSARNGGAATWGSYSLDPATGDLFVPTGNPAPDYAAGVRPGINLFSDSIVVLAATTGRLRWWYQLVAHDSHDWDVAAPPALYATNHGDAVLAAAGKDGFVHIVDRTTHKLLVKTPVTSMSNTDLAPTTSGVHTCPGALGGIEWNGPAIDTSRRLMFVGSVDMCGTYRLGNTRDIPGRAMYGGTFRRDRRATGWLYALDIDDGTVRWRRHVFPIVGGIVATSGGVVFAGDLAGRLYAFESEKGSLLWIWPATGAVGGGIISYQVDGRQYVAAATGNVSRNSLGGSGEPTVLIFTLGNSGRKTVVDDRPRLSDDRLESGSNLFASQCSTCHGVEGAGGLGPNLVGEASRQSLSQTTSWIMNPKPPMPKLYPTALTAREVDIIASYVQSL